MDLKSKAIMELKDVLKEYMSFQRIGTGQLSSDDAVREKLANMIYETIIADKWKRKNILETESENIKKWLLAELGRIKIDP